MNRLKAFFKFIKPLVKEVILTVITIMLITLVHSII